MTDSWGTCAPDADSERTYSSTVIGSVRVPSVADREVGSPGNICASTVANAGHPDRAVVDYYSPFLHTLQYHK
jgi:hypothetical protein